MAQSHLIHSEHQQHQRQHDDPFQHPMHVQSMTDDEGYHLNAQRDASHSLAASSLMSGMMTNITATWRRQPQLLSNVRLRFSPARPAQTRPSMAPTSTSSEYNNNRAAEHHGRRHPWMRSAIRVIVSVMAAGVYFHIFFTCQPDRSINTIREMNQQMEQQLQNRQHQQQARALPPIRNLQKQQVEQEAYQYLAERQRHENIVRVQRAEPTIPPATTEQVQKLLQFGTSPTHHEGNVENSQTMSLDKGENLVELEPQSLLQKQQQENLHDSWPVRMVRTVLRFVIVAAMLSAILRWHVRQCLVPRWSRLRRRQRRYEEEQRHARFRAWVMRLNRQRRANGQPPISVDSLRLVMQDREFSSGDDYDGLLRFNEEAGPAVEALLNSMGASDDEIDRCPTRRLDDPNDELLVASGMSRSQQKPSLIKQQHPQCAICLEVYHVGETIRTIPCFHTFHRHCIDPWLRSKAVCPICKYPAVG